MRHSPDILAYSLGCAWLEASCAIRSLFSGPCFEEGTPRGEVFEERETRGTEWTDELASCYPRGMRLKERRGGREGWGTADKEQGMRLAGAVGFFEN